MTDLLLVRHGEATHNLQGRLEGWGSTPLSHVRVGPTGSSLIALNDCQHLEEKEFA